MRIEDRPGLQAERTDLSWVRTSTAILANGALLLVRADMAAPSTLALVGGAIALILAFVALAVARRRRRVLARRPLPDALAAPFAILTLAAGTVCLALSVLVMLLIQ